MECPPCMDGWCHYNIEAPRDMELRGAVRYLRISIRGFSGEIGKEEKNRKKLGKRRLYREIPGIKVVNNGKNGRGVLGCRARAGVVFARVEVVLARVGVGIGQAGGTGFSTGRVLSLKIPQEKWSRRRKKCGFSSVFPLFVESLSTAMLAVVLFA